MATGANGRKPEIETLREQRRILWAAIDRIHSMVWEKEKSGFELTNTETHIRDLTVETMNTVHYPGEPPEAADEEPDET